MRPSIGPNVPPYDSNGSILKAGQLKWAHYSLKEKEDFLERATHGLHNQHLHRFLKWKYPEERLLERCGEIYPVAIFPSPSAQERNPDSVITGYETKFESDTRLLLKDGEYRALSDSVTKARRTDGYVFTMKRLDYSENNLGLTVGNGSYFRTLDTCDVLEWEILSNSHYLHDSSIIAFEEFDKRLSLRSRLHQSVANPVRNGTGRSAAIAISTLVAFRTEGQYVILLKKRSSAGVAVHKGLVHVIPSFMFQPVTKEVAKELSVVHNVLREYLEELFDVPELDDPNAPWNYFYDHPHLDFLKLLMETKPSASANLYLTGVTVNLLNLRPEICVLLLIDDEDWWRRHNPLDEKNPSRLKFNPERASHFTVTLADKDEIVMKNGHDLLRPGHMVPPGAAALWLGIDLIRALGSSLTKES